MKSLLLKDFYMMIKYCRAFLFIIIVFLVVSVFGDNNMFFIMYPLVISSVIPVTLISYDEMSKWNIYSEALPFSRNQIVSSKYLVSIIVIAVTWLTSILTQVLFVMPRLSISWAQINYIAILLLAVGLISPSIILPVIFKFGVQKGRIAYYLVIGIICALATFLFSTDNFTFNISEKMLMPILLISSTIIFILSWLVSLNVYKKREL